MTTRDKLVDVLFDFMRNQRVSCRENVSLGECNYKCKDLYELWGCIPKKQAEELADALIESDLVVDDTIYKVGKTTVGKEWCYECPKCKFLFSYAGNYCPKCGCKLKE